MNKVVEIIREEIHTRGPISFERFMELALYCPDCGYYETIKDRIGRQGDYYTSVSVGSVFGHLLAAQFFEWLQSLFFDTNLGQAGPSVGSGTELRIVECGAHDGQLAKDILGWLRGNRPALFARLQYALVEPSTGRRKAQEQMLAPFLDHVSWFKDLRELRRASPPGTFRGVIFSNELLDAMPVRVLRWNTAETAWFEWGVGCNGEQFCWARLAESTSPFSLPALAEPRMEFSQLSECLPDGYQVEVGDAAVRWWRDAARCLDRGWLVTIDYGFGLEEQFSPSRIQGSLRGYRQHQVVQDALATPGEQDITAQVNFSSLQAVGEEQGLQSQEIISQAKFLTRAASILWRDSRDPWDAKSTRQFQTLTHPDHLGRAFQIIVQSRGLRR